MAKRTTTKRGPGRPKGSKNADATATEIPARCAFCESSDLLSLSLRVQDHSGTTPAGERYTRIERRLKRCQACGRNQIVKTYLFNPQNWRE